MRPRVINQERERLYDDAMKQKITANFFKEENVRLKTKVHILESEMAKKDRLVDELLQQQENFNLPTTGGAFGKGKSKLDSHLNQNLKRKIKDLQGQLQAKQEEIEGLKRNIKNTKIAEVEVEMKMYMDECTRLRH